MEKFWNNYWRIFSVVFALWVTFECGQLVGDPPSRTEPYTTLDALTALAYFAALWFIGWGAGRESKK